ncbi:MAG: SDR family NAD(P)-dependent oxidoreductase [Bdellovibrionales bacterium]|nr:SDR family NAD(P)-dependent oxidoreductase [Bdellovibrionales bacterium]
MKILVTGGAGFIGSHLAKKLLDEGHEVVVYDNMLLGTEKNMRDCLGHRSFQFVKADILDRSVLRKHMEGVHTVFHMAANSDISEGAKRTDLDLQIGTVATYEVLEAMRVSSAREIVFASTSAIYGEAEVRPTPESYGPLQPISFYGASKLSCEALLTAFAHNYDFKVWIYRFANIVGSHSTHGAIYDFVHRLKKRPETLEVLGNGQQKKSYLHVSDCVDGILFGFKKFRDQGVFCVNLASEGVTEVRKIAEFVTQEFVKAQKARGGSGAPVELKFGDSDRGWKGDVPFTWLDGSKYQQMGWKARFNSDDAVRLSAQEIVAEILDA